MMPSMETLQGKLELHKMEADRKKKYEDMEQANFVILVIN